MRRRPTRNQLFLTSMSQSVSRRLVTSCLSLSSVLSHSIRGTPSSPRPTRPTTSPANPTMSQHLVSSVTLHRPCNLVTLESVHSSRGQMHSLVHNQASDNSHRRLLTASSMVKMILDQVTSPTSALRQELRGEAVGKISPSFISS